MILLDTDHLSVLKYRTSARAIRLTAKMSLAELDGHKFATSVITFEENMRGWLASIAKEKLPKRQVAPYRELAELIHFFQGFEIAHFSDAAAEIFLTYGSIHIKASDRKIAAIAVENNALLLTANKRHFEQIPGLRIENWMDPAL